MENVDTNLDGAAEVIEQSQESASGWTDYGPSFVNSQVDCDIGDYTFLTDDEIKDTVIGGMHELNEAFELELDALILIARHFNWNKDRMNNWFGPDQPNLKLILGLEFDPTLTIKHPEMSASLPGQHGGYCLVCYEELNDNNKFALACNHTFCVDCWRQYLSDKVIKDALGIYATC